MATLDFTSSITGEYNLMLTDRSDYTGVTVNNRYWVIIKSDGTEMEFNWPIANGVNMTIPIDKDYAFVVKLAINYDPPTNTQGLSKIKNLLVAPFISDIIYDLRKKQVDLLFEKNTQEEAHKLLKRIELISSFYEAAVWLTSTDILASQQALDMGNDQANNLKCEI